MTGSPSIQTRSQKRAHPSSCAWRLADEWSESESDDDSDDDRGDDFESTSDDDGQKPCLDISHEDFDRALAIGYGCKDGSHSSVLPAQHIVSIQCQISRASSREKISSSSPWLAGCCTVRRDNVARAPCWCACEDKISF